MALLTGSFLKASSRLAEDDVTHVMLGRAWASPLLPVQTQAALGPQLLKKPPPARHSHKHPAYQGSILKAPCRTEAGA